MFRLELFFECNNKYVLSYYNSINEKWTKPKHAFSDPLIIHEKGWDYNSIKV